MNLVLRPAAVTDLAAARKYYADARPGFAGGVGRAGDRPGLDEEFAANLDEVFSRLAAFPYSARLVSGYEPVRRAILRHFPYAVFWAAGALHARDCESPGDDRIEVLRIVHTAQAPGVWRT